MSRTAKFDGCCSSCFGMLTCRNISIFLVVVYAIVMRDVLRLSTPMFSEQWFAEIIWWTKFVIFRGYYITPIPLTTMKHQHSKIDVIEFFPERDADAFENFLQMSNDPKYYNTILVVRNLWANHTDVPIMKYNSVEHFKERCDLTKEYIYYNMTNGPPKKELGNFGKILDSLKQKSALNALSFEFTIARKDKNLQKDFKDSTNLISPELTNIYMSDRESRAQHFVYWGNRTYAPLHGTFVGNYFLMISNAKKWFFVHKAYVPYGGFVQKTNAGGALTTPYYRLDDYPAPGIPYTTVDVHAGDLMFFGPWVLHEVGNYHADQLGFAVGARPTRLDRTKSFSPLDFSIILQLPKILFLKVKKGSNWIGKMYTDQDRSQTCGNDFGFYWDHIFNGSVMTRGDYHKVDGKCQYAEREHGFQQKELAGTWGISDWHPRTQQ